MAIGANASRASALSSGGGRGRRSFDPLRGGGRARPSSRCRHPLARLDGDVVGSDHEADGVGLVDAIAAYLADEVFRLEPEPGDPSPPPAGSNLEAALEAVEGLDEAEIDARLSELAGDLERDL